MSIEGAPTHMAAPTAWPFPFDLQALNALCQWAQPGTYSNISSAGTTTLKNVAGTLRRVVINKAVAAGSITLYDNTAASGDKIATITLPAVLLESQSTLNYGARFLTGLTVVVVGAIDITVVWE